MWTTCDITWRVRLEFSISSNSAGPRYKKSFWRASQITSYTRKKRWLRPSSLNPASSAEWRASNFFTSKEELVKCISGNTLGSVLTNERFFEEDDPIDQRSGPSHTYSESCFPVEEPWLFLPSNRFSSSEEKQIPVTSPKKEPSGNDEAEPIVHDQLEQNPEKFFPVEGSNVIAEDDSVTTVILINSSICTMQRIAVLENGKLVELLLEPVKSNVQCDSIYLGVVTKLAPHMGGAFVNIGCSRASFMDIRPHRDPFIFPPFGNDTKDGQENITMFRTLQENRCVPESETILDEIEEFDDIEHGEVEDNSVDYMDEDFVEHEDSNYRGISENFDEISNGSAVGHEAEASQKELIEKFTEKGDLQQIQTIEQDAINYKISEPDKSKWANVRKGTKIVVQVVKEGLGAKGPTLTAYPKLRSRFWILIACCSTIGISRKISGVERTRLRVIAKALQPTGFGLTVRTVAAGQSLEELQKDLQGLLSTWKIIMEHATSASLAADEGVDGAIPVMLHRAMGQTLSVVQDYFSDKVKSLIVDSPRTYHEVTSYLQEIAPNICDRVELYHERTPLFDHYKVEEEIDNILSKRVSLTNGGYLVIEQTEALVSIDVNGGHCMLGQGTSQEKAILDVNLAAAKQIARELRLRDIGGIIVVDFIDMVDDSNKRLVYEEFKQAVERDRSTVKVSELSRHGLMEITRKRVRPSVTFMISEPCTCCHGTGRVEALETVFSKIEHAICRFLSTVDQKPDPENPKLWPRFILRVDRYMCNYLTSGKRTRLAILSSSLKVWILLKVARGLARGSFELKPLIDGKMHKHPHQAAISVLPPAEIGTYASQRKLTLFPIKKLKTGGR